MAQICDNVFLPRFKSSQVCDRDLAKILDEWIEHTYLLLYNFLECRTVRHLVSPVPDWQEISMPEPVRYQNKKTLSGTGMLRYRTEMIPMPAASALMSMPNYGNVIVIVKFTLAVNFLQTLHFDRSRPENRISNSIMWRRANLQQMPHDLFAGNFKMTRACLQYIVLRPCRAEIRSTVPCPLLCFLYSLKYNDKNRKKIAV